MSRCKKDEEELEEDEEKSETFIIDNLEDVTESVLSILPEIAVFLEKILIFSSPLMLSNSSSLR